MNQGAQPLYLCNHVARFSFWSPFKSNQKGFSPKRTELIPKWQGCSFGLLATKREGPKERRQPTGSPRKKKSQLKNGRGRVKTNTIPCWGRCTTHLEPIFVVGLACFFWGYALGFDPWPTRSSVPFYLFFWGGFSY